MKTIEIVYGDESFFCEVDETGIPSVKDLPEGWEECCDSEAKTIDKLPNIILKAQNAIKTSFQIIEDGIKNLKAKEVEAELCFKISAEAGGAVILSKTSADATFRVRVKW